MEEINQDKINPSYEPIDEEKYYKGFMLVQCEKCGQVRGFCTKREINYYHCKCGHDTTLNDLKIAYVECDKCGGKFKYWTNMESGSFTVNCVSCNNPVDMVINKRRTTYVTRKKDKIG